MTIRNINEVIVTKTNKYNPITPADLLKTYNDGCGYVGFIGGVELTPAESNDLVPVGFLNSTKPIMTTVQKQRTTIDPNTSLEVIEEYTELEPTGEVEQKTWKEYSLNNISNTTGNYLLTFMHVWENGNRHKISESDEALEWRKWYEQFGAKLMTKSEFRNKRISAEYTQAVV